MPPRTRGFYDVARRRVATPRVVSHAEYEQADWKGRGWILMGVITDRANTLRAMFEGDFTTAERVHTYPREPFELRDTKSGLWVGTTVTGGPQAMRCKFCKKQVASWSGLSKGKKQAGKRRHGQHSWPKQLMEAVTTHLDLCAYEWLRLVIAKEATALLTDVECAHYRSWMEKYMKPVSDENHRGYNNRPRELEPLFKNNPHPPGSDMAQNLEVALIAISRMWSY